MNSQTGDVASSHAMPADRRNWKRQETDSLLEPKEGIWP